MFSPEYDVFSLTQTMLFPAMCMAPSSAEGGEILGCVLDIAESTLHLATCVCYILLCSLISCSYGETWGLGMFTAPHFNWFYLLLL